MKTIEEKIKNKVYAKAWIASAVVKRADISTRERNKLLALVEQTYRPTGEEVTETANAGMELELPTLKRIDAVSAYPIEVTLDAELGRIALRLLHLCVDHKLSREEMYKRLEGRLMAGMG